MNQSHHFALHLLGWATLLSTELMSQCATTWVQGMGVPGTDGDVLATAFWDPDGSGPLPPRLIAGGDFSLAGNVAANRIAVWDFTTSTWSAFGAGPDASVRAIAAMPNGDLIVGGLFTTIDGVAAGHIARWNGTSWVPLGAGLDAAVYAIEVLGNGHIVVGGQFTQAGGAPADHIARWDGTGWSPLGAGLNASVSDLATLPGGDIVAAGYFTQAGGSAAGGLAQWSGTAWTPIGPSINAYATAVTVLQSGEVVACVTWSFYGPHIMRSSGGTWQQLGSGQSSANVLAVLSTGDLVAGGAFSSIGGTAARNVAIWNGSSWAAMDGLTWFGNRGVASLTSLPGGGIVAGGDFGSSTTAAMHIAEWTGSFWEPLGVGNMVASSLTPLRNGDVVAVGSFDTIGGTIAHSVARLSSAGWAPIGTGIPSWRGFLEGAVELPNGDIVVCGLFDSIGAAAAGTVARWDGVSWSTIGALGGPVRGLAVTPAGELLIGCSTPQGGPAVQRWTGTSWTPLGNLTGAALRLAALRNGDVIAAGLFTIGGTPGNVYCARWDGVSWSAFAGGTFYPSMIRALPDGDLLIAGDFTSIGGVAASHIARWNGIVWAPLGSGTSGTVSCAVMLPNEDLLVGGSFTTIGGVPADNLARWDGSTWTAVAGGADGGLGAMALSGSRVLATGGFRHVGGKLSAFFAELTTTCPASTQTATPGCAGQLESTLPWVGAAWQAHATGLPAAALVFLVSGFSGASLPLNSVFATALPGCVLGVQADSVCLTLSQGGEASVAMQLPNAQALSGVTFRHQMVSLALDATLTVTATNTLVLQVGMF